MGDTALVRALLQRCANIQSTDAKGRTALHVAAKHGRTELLQVLVLAGGDVNKVSDDKRQLIFVRKDSHCM